MDVSNKYVQLNTQLTTEQATVIPAMNGRQGDNNRQVFFQVKDGDMNHNLNGQTVQLAVMDSKEVPKVLSGAYTVDNAAIGRFSLMIPWNFYQASGDSVQGFIRFLEGDTVVSSIPIQYTVYQNRLTFTQTESKAFLSDVDDMVAKANAKFEQIEQQLSAAQTSSKILTDSVDSLNESIDKNRVALKNVDNTFTGENTFEKKIVATNGIQGKADSAGQADEANHATNSDNAKKADVATHAIDADNAKNADLANRLNSTYSQTIKDLTVSKLNITGQSKNNVFRKTSVSVGDSKSADLFRVGNVVMFTIPAQAWGNSDIEAWSVTPITVPVGYRPVSVSTLSFVNNWKSGLLTVFTDGSVHSTDFGIIGRTAFEAYGVWITDDDFPG